VIEGAHYIRTQKKYKWELVARPPLHFSTKTGEKLEIIISKEEFFTEREFKIV